MFKLQPNPTFKARVAISIPGQVKPADVEMEFRHMSKESVKAFFETLADRTDAESIAEIVVGWTGVDEAFSADALGKLLDNFPSAAGAIFKTFSRELFEARSKN